MRENGKIKEAEREVKDMSDHYNLIKDKDAYVRNALEQKLKDFGVECGTCSIWYLLDLFIKHVEGGSVKEIEALKARLCIALEEISHNGTLAHIVNERFIKELNK